MNEPRRALGPDRVVDRDVEGIVTSLIPLALGIAGWRFAVWRRDRVS